MWIWWFLILLVGSLPDDGEAGLGVWTKPLGLEGARPWALAIAPSDPRIVYAGTQDWGGYKSTDRGETWIQMVQRLPVSSAGIDLRAIVVDPTNPHVVYASSGDGGLPPLAADAWGLFREDGFDVDIKGSGGISKSVDGGKTWRAVNVGLTNKGVYVLLIDPTAPQTLYAGAIQKGVTGEWESSGVFKSMDGGEHWQQLDGGVLRTSQVVALALDSQHPQVLYAGTLDRGLFRSADGGMTWQQLVAGPQKDVVTVVVVPDDPEVVYAGAYRHGIFTSVDGGHSWTVVSQGLPTQRVVVLALDPHQPTTLYAGTFDQGVFRSEDGGQIWQGASEGLLDPTVLSLAVDPQDPRILYAGTKRGGVFKTTDGGHTWRQVNTGLANGYLLSLALVPGVPPTLYAGTDGGGVFQSRDGGQHWQGMREGLTEWVITALAATPEVVYAGTELGGIVRRRYDEPQWERVGGDRTWGQVTVLWVNPGNLERVDVGTTRGGFRRSRDGGRTWRQVVVGEVWALAVAPSVLQIRYLGVYGEGVWRSDDEGETWKLLPGQPMDRRILSLAVDPRNPAVVYAGLERGRVVKTEDGGRSWRQLSDMLPEVVAILISAGNPQYLYVGGTSQARRIHEQGVGGGILRSTDGGESWVWWGYGLREDMPELARRAGSGVRALVGDPEETMYVGVRIGHGGGGVYMYTERLQPVPRFTFREAAVRKNGQWLLLTILDATSSTSDVRGSSVTYRWTFKPTLPLLSGTMTAPLIAVERRERIQVTLMATTAGGATSSTGGRFLMAGKVPPLLGDITGDGRVDVHDRSALGQRYGAKTGEVRYHPAADLEFDGRIDLRDLRLLDQVRRAGVASGKPASDTTGIAEGQESLMRSALLPNVPNPFNAETVVRYQVGGREGESQSVVLRVYDLAGQVVRTLVETAQLPGMYAVVWDGRDGHGREVASGAYLMRLEAGTIIRIRKLLLLR